MPALGTSLNATSTDERTDRLLLPDIPRRSC